MECENRRMKVLYRPIRTCYKRTQFEVMRCMVNDLLLHGKVNEMFPASSGNKEGVYAETSNGGKKFWTLKELTQYFVKKNNEDLRMR